MKIITGNWLRKSDPKEVVASILPKLEEVLAERGFSFTSEYINPLLYRLSTCIRKYNGVWVEEYNIATGFSAEGKEFLEMMKADFLESRSKFIGRIDKFARDEIPHTWTLDRAAITICAYIPNLPLTYKWSDGYCVSLDIFPGKDVSSYEYNVGIFSDYKSREKDREVVEQMTDASNLVVRISADAKTEKEIKQAYRRFRS